MESIDIPDIGTFTLEGGCYTCPRTFFEDVEIDVRVYPRGNDKPSDEWKAARAREFALFSERFESEIKRLPDMVRKLCREYEMYEGIEIPWTDDEFMDGFKWYDIKMNGDGTIECCGEPTQSPVNNFSVLFGFSKDMKLEYAHFDG